jgi:hypothetical protein
MFADPAVVTINAVAKNLVKINQDQYSSEYMLREALGEYRLTIRNSTRKDKSLGVNIDRHTIELKHTIYPVAPAVTGFTRKVYTVVENQQGDTLADPVNEALGLLAFLSASSGANTTKMLNFES